jgi:hypothetical protein
LWLLAPARHRSSLVLQRALETPIRTRPIFGTATVPGLFETIGQILLLPRGAISREELRRIARSWGLLLESGALRKAFSERTAAPGSVDADIEAQVSDVEGHLVELLAELWRLAPAEPAGDHDEAMLITLVKDEIQSALLNEIEVLCASLRQEGVHESGVEGHWRRWVAVRELADSYLQLLGERRELLYDSVGARLWNHGAWLYNTEHARVLAHDVFHWVHALVPKGHADEKALRGNARLSRGA